MNNIMFKIINVIKIQKDKYKIVCETETKTPKVFAGQYVKVLVDGEGEFYPIIDNEDKHISFLYKNSNFDENTKILKKGNTLMLTFPFFEEYPIPMPGETTLLIVKDFSWELVEYYIKQNKFSKFIMWTNKKIAFKNSNGKIKIDLFEEDINIKLEDSLEKIMPDRIVVFSNKEFFQTIEKHKNNLYYPIFFIKNK